MKHNSPTAESADRPKPGNTHWQAARNKASTIGRFLLDGLLPPRCLACETSVDQPGMLCPPCWSGVRFIGAPFCDCCGEPFEYDPGGQMLCARCIATPPLFEHARAALHYDDGSRGLVLALKHGDRLDSAPALGRWMARAGADILAHADIVAPVPMHRRRLLARRYNQAALLALAIWRESGGSGSGKDVLPDLLQRTRATPPQGGRSRAGRFSNVRGAFALRRSYAQDGRVEGRRVLLVDDVMTTGATVQACVKCLLDNGAAAVDVVTLARVVLDN